MIRGAKRCCSSCVYGVANCGVDLGVLCKLKGRYMMADQTCDDFSGYTIKIDRQAIGDLSQMIGPYPLCRDCKHAEVRELDSIPGGNWYCHGCPDFVDGHFNACRYNRENQAICGREARFFEPKEKEGK